jgi:hypothetical protein
VKNGTRDAPFRAGEGGAGEEIVRIFAAKIGNHSLRALDDGRSYSAENPPRY